MNPKKKAINKSKLRIFKASQRKIYSGMGDGESAKDIPGMKRLSTRQVLEGYKHREQRERNK